MARNVPRHKRKEYTMAIEKAEVFVTSPGRNFVVFRITTTDGVVGLGDATLNGRELVAAKYLETIAPSLIGKNEDNIEDIWQYLYKGAYWKRGPVTMAAISAVDVALWDIKAKKAGVPVYELLGGASRTGILTYAHASGVDFPSLFDSIDMYRDMGFKATRIQFALPGIPSTYGVAGSANAQQGSGEKGLRYDYEPARRTTVPVEEVWDARTYLNTLPGVFEEVRNKYGKDLILLHDSHHRLSPIQAARFGKLLEPYDLFWMEDSTPAEENQEFLRVVRQHTTTPIAIGEIINSWTDYITLIKEQLIDYVRSAVTHTGGLTHMKKLMAFAELFGVKSGFHGPTDVSPVGMAANLHLDLAIPNFGIQEYMKHSDETLEVFHTSYMFKDGYLHPGNKPGLGVDFDEKLAAKYPYQPAPLPVDRLLDGTMHEW